MRGPRVQEQRQLRRQPGRKPELRREGVQLDVLRAVVQPVVVEPELAEGDEGGGRGGLDERGEVRKDLGGLLLRDG